MGATTTVDFSVYNGATVRRFFSANVSRIPGSWIDSQPGNISLEPSELKNLSLKVTVPNGTQPGLYFATVSLETDAGALTSTFLLRLRVYPGGYSFPTFFRSVSIDYGLRQTIVSLRMSSRVPQNTIRVFETIPKEVAQDVGEVLFDTPPSFVLDRDPRVSWVLFDVQAGQAKEFRYRVDKPVVGLEHYSNWYIDSVEVVPQVEELESIAVSDFYSPQIAAGGFADLKFSLRNKDTKQHRVRVALTLPEGWRADPRELEVALEGLSSSPVSFRVSVPRETKQGSYSAGIFMLSGNQSLRRDVVMTVTAGESLEAFAAGALPFIGAVLAAVMLLLIVKAARGKLRGRKPPSSERAGALSTISGLVRSKGR